MPVGVETLCPGAANVLAAGGLAVPDAVTNRCACVLATVGVLTLGVVLGAEDGTVYLCPVTIELDVVVVVLTTCPAPVTDIVVFREVADGAMEATDDWDALDEGGRNCGLRTRLSTEEVFRF